MASKKTAKKPVKPAAKTTAKRTVKPAPAAKAASVSVKKTAPAPAKKPAPAKAKAVPAPAKKPVAAPAKGAKGRAAAEAAPQVVSPFSAKELEQYRDLLLKIRDRVIDEVNFLARDNLNKSSKEAAGDLSSYSFHMADQGTDNFDREFAANLLSGEQDVLYEIEEALRRIEQNTYGVCEMSGKPIERERLRIIPYARYSVAEQSKIEKGKPRYRPFRRSSIQSMASET